MICNHVLGLIDAGPFADYPPARLEAAWRHAESCDRCGRALTAARALTSDLEALPHAAPPADLSVAVLARIERIERTSPAPAADASSYRAVPDWAAPATSLGGLAAALAIVLSMPPEALLALVLSRVSGLSADFMTTPAEALVLGASLALYLSGLFASTAARRRPATDDARPRRPS